MIHKVRNVMSPIPQARRFGCGPNGGGYTKSSIFKSSSLDSLAGLPSEEPGSGTYVHTTACIEFGIVRQRCMALIHHLVQAEPDRSTKREQVPDERRIWP